MHEDAAPQHRGHAEAGQDRPRGERLRVLGRHEVRCRGRERDPGEAWDLSRFAGLARRRPARPNERAVSES